MTTSSQNKNISVCCVLALIHSPTLPTDLWIIEVLKHNSHIKQKVEKKNALALPGQSKGHIKKNPKTKKPPNPKNPPKKSKKKLSLTFCTLCST